MSTYHRFTMGMCQIMHSLRSRGDMSFEEISNTIPCIEVAHDIGITDLQADQGYRPRCFKTHFWYPDCPKGGRYIVVVRGTLLWRCTYAHADCLSHRPN